MSSVLCLLPLRVLFSGDSHSCSATCQDSDKSLWIFMNSPLSTSLCGIGGKPSPRDIPELSSLSLGSLPLSMSFHLVLINSGPSVGFGFFCPLHLKGGMTGMLFRFNDAAGLPSKPIQWSKPDKAIPT